MLSESERLETVRTVVSAHGGEKFVIAGVDERSARRDAQIVRELCQCWCGLHSDADTAGNGSCGFGAVLRGGDVEVSGSGGGYSPDVCMGRRSSCSSVGDRRVVRDG